MRDIKPGQLYEINGSMFCYTNINCALHTSWEWLRAKDILLILEKYNDIDIMCVALCNECKIIVMTDDIRKSAKLLKR